MAKRRMKRTDPIADTMGAELKVWNEKPISKGYGIIDNDLATDNLQNDIPMADLQDLQ